MVLNNDEQCPSPTLHMAEQWTWVRLQTKTAPFLSKQPQQLNLSPRSDVAAQSLTARPLQEYLHGLDYVVHCTPSSNSERPPNMPATKDYAPVSSCWAVVGCSSGQPSE
jgi:hypothetical protein